MLLGDGDDPEDLPYAVRAVWAWMWRHTTLICEPAESARRRSATIDSGVRAGRSSSWMR
jgi:hypothetical protein